MSEHFDAPTSKQALQSRFCMHMSNVLNCETLWPSASVWRSLMVSGVVLQFFDDLAPSVKLFLHHLRT